jgi:hypothetical protein
MKSKMRAINYYIILFVFTSVLIASCKKNGSVSPTPPVDEVATYEKSNEVFVNPDRGFIRTFIVFSEGASLNTAQIQLLRSQNVSMILRLFYFDAFKNKALSTAELTLIQTDLNKIRDAGLKAILRFAYTDSQTGTDAPLNIVEQHLTQLQPVFEANKDVIAFVQAGFIGAWGEWHSSSNGLTTLDNQRKVLNKFLSVLPQGIMIQVRTPGAKQQIFSTTAPLTSDIAYSAESRARVGHHNDCFLTGGTDYGTYTNVTLEKQYISNEALYVPTGGETCPPSPGYDPSCNEGRNEMRLLKWTYLNLDWYGPTINAWKTAGCFDEFQRNLGYRLALVNSKINEKATVNGTLPLKITITNDGYAPLYNRKTTSLIFKNKTSGTYYSVALAVDLRICKPQQETMTNESVSLNGIPAGSYDLYLRVADNADNLKSRVEYAVRFANTGVWTNDNGGMNKLKTSLTIQ